MLVTMPNNWQSSMCEGVTGCQFAAASAVATVLAQHGQIDTFGFSLPLRFENAIVSYAIYLRQLIWPIDLAVLYPHPEKFFPFPIIAGCIALLMALARIIKPLFGATPIRFGRIRSR